jgi:phosphoribosylglycinamide formyltransferase-1
MDRGLLVLASGTGTLAEAIIRASQDGELSAHILAVLTDKPEAEVVSKCASLGVPIITHPLQEDRETWNEELFLITESLNPSLVVSAGFMRILAPEYVTNFKVINSHPSLLPNFPGAHAVRDALKGNTTVTGTTIHWVDAGMDTGKVIASREVPILVGDTEELLHERIKIVERGLIVATISQVLDSMETAHE